MTKKSEAQKRDEVLDALEVTRAKSIRLARDVAAMLVKHQGVVTSADVHGFLRRNHASAIAGLDPRFLGAVFRRGWKRKGYRSQGSHGRPVSVWVRRGN